MRLDLHPDSSEIKPELVVFEGVGLVVLSDYRHFRPSLAVWGACDFSPRYIGLPAHVSNTVVAGPRLPLSLPRARLIPGSLRLEVSRQPFQRSASRKPSVGSEHESRDPRTQAWLSPDWAGRELREFRRSRRFRVIPETPVEYPMQVVWEPHSGIAGQNTPQSQRDHRPHPEHPAPATRPRPLPQFSPAPPGSPSASEARKRCRARSDAKNCSWAPWVSGPGNACANGVHVVIFAGCILP